MLGHTIISPYSQFKPILGLTKSFRVELCKHRSKYQCLVTKPSILTMSYYMSSQSSSEQSCFTTKVFLVSHHVAVSLNGMFHVSSHDYRTLIIKMSRVNSLRCECFVSVIHQSALEVTFVKKAALVRGVFHFGYVILVS